VYPPIFLKFIVSDCVRKKPIPSVYTCRGWTATDPGNNINCDNFIFVKNGRIAVACLAAFSNAMKGGRRRPNSVPCSQNCSVSQAPQFLLKSPPLFSISVADFLT
jgi:hypothetical protein